LEKEKGESPLAAAAASSSKYHGMSRWMKVRGSGGCSYGKRDWEENPHGEESKAGETVLSHAGFKQLKGKVRLWGYYPTQVITDIPHFFILAKLHSG